MAITIFLCHVSFIVEVPFGKSIFEKYFNNGYFGIVFFLVLSGFFISLNYGEKFETLNFDKFVGFIKKRIIKIYPTYILTMTFVFIWWIIKDVSVSSIIENILYFLLCIPMLQTVDFNCWWLFNSAAWFISCIFVLYAISPLILKNLYKIRKNNKKLLLLIILAYIILFVLASKNFMILKEFDWDTYFAVSPFYWIFYYFIGLITGLIFKNIKNCVNVSSNSFSFLEILMVIVTVIVYFIGMNLELNKEYIKIIYLTNFIFLIIIFAYDKGIISKILSWPLNIYLGNVSMEFYLIHYLVVAYGSKILGSCFGFTENNIFVFCIILFFTSLMVSIGIKKFLRNISIKIKLKRIKTSSKTCV